MSPWFRRRRQGAAPPPEVREPEPEVREPEPEVREPEPEVREPDPTAPLSPDRLDSALKRLRQEIPAPSEESPPGPSA